MADISKIKTLDGTTYNIKDATARTTANNAYTRPLYEVSGQTNDIAMRPLVPDARACRTWFLPADQIIIVQTADGGTTWTDAGISDVKKTQLFSATRPSGINLPRINNARSTDCGLRVIFSAMKYNVPSGTTETAKYGYWNSTYVNRQERYTNLTEFWFWLGANGDTFRTVVEAATGAKSTTWVKCFDTDDYEVGMTGWSGADWCRFNAKTFGGSSSQTGNYWNWRITFWSRYAQGKSAFQQTSAQSIHQINGYGSSYWGTPNNLMKNDHLYSFDYLQNATFPAKVTATGGFTGDLTGTATKATGDASGNNIKSSYAASMSLSANTLTLKNKDGGTLSTATLPSNLIFTNTTVATTAFAYDGTHSPYDYKATIPLTGVTASMIPFVSFSIADVEDGNFAPSAESYAGGIYIYSNRVPSASITIPTIMLVS